MYATINPNIRWRSVARVARCARWARELRDVGQQRRMFSSPLPPSRGLPPTRQNWFYVAPLALAIGSAWLYFIVHATNDEKASASIIKQLATNIRDSHLVAEAFGDDIHMEGTWWLPGGRPWISGKVEMPRGLVDVSFRVRGSKGAGMVYFTSIRKQKGADFTNLRYKIIGDDGTELDLLPTIRDEQD